MAPEPSAEPFAIVLRRLLDEQDVSVRGLAKRLAQAHNRDTESQRRQLQSYLAGENVPRVTRVREIARALGVPPELLLAGMRRHITLVERLDVLQASVGALDERIEQAVATASARQDRSEQVVKRIGKVVSELSSHADRQTDLLARLEDVVSQLEEQTAVKPGRTSGRASGSQKR